MLPALPICLPEVEHNHSFKTSSGPSPTPHHPTQVDLSRINSLIAQNAGLKSLLEEEHLQLEVRLVDFGGKGLVSGSCSQCGRLKGCKTCGGTQWPCD